MSESNQPTSGGDADADGGPRGGERDPHDPHDVHDPHDPHGALRETNYAIFAFGFLWSSMGLQMLATALGWEIYQRTKDPMALGWIGVARALPVVLFALPAGHIIDHFDRRRVLVATQLMMGLAAAGLGVVSWVGDAPLWVYYAALVGLGCARSFNGPSRATLLPLLVSPGAFHNAVTWNSGLFHFSATAGPIIAGVLLGHMGGYWPVYAIASGACVLFACLAMLLKPRDVPRAAGPMSWGSMFAGAGHIWREKTLLGALTLDLFAVMLGGATALLPIYAADILHAGEVAYGMLRAAMPLGACVMALLLTRVPPFEKSGAALLWSVAGFGACMVGFGFSREVGLSMGLLFIAGAFDAVSVVVRHVLVQVRTPNHLRGRVSAVNSVFIESSNEIGAFESGLVAALFSPVVSVVSGGLGTLVVVGVIARAWPQLRRLGRLREEDAQARAAREAAPVAGENPTP